MDYKKLVPFILLVLISISGISQTIKTEVRDKKDRLIQKNRVNFYGKLENDLSGIATIKYEYDRKGKLEKKSYFNKDGQMIKPDTSSVNLEYPSYTLYKYNELGLISEISNHYFDGSYLDLANKPAVKRFKYKNNQLIDEFNFDKRGKLRGVGNLEKAVVKYTYAGRQLIEVRSYDKDKKILDFGLNIERHTYDSLGRRARTTYHFANSEIFLTDRYFYNNKGQLIKKESYKKNGQLDYSVKYTYASNDQIIKREYQYSNRKTEIEKHGFEVSIPGWKITNLPSLDAIKDIDGIGAFYFTLDQAGNIKELRRSHGKDPLMYAVMPYILQIKFEKDDKNPVSNLKGEIKVGVLNKDIEVEEF